MKQLLTVFAAVLLMSGVFAQSPDRMSYQAVIRNSSDQLVVNTQIGMRISIQKYVFGIPPTYDNIYIETHTPETDANGLISLEVGGGTVVGGDFAAIDWADGIYYIKTDTDPAGGTNYTISGRSQLLSVPYALHAKNAKTYKIGDYAQGGIVFRVDESGQHGLVCDKTDQPENARWNAGTNIRTTAFSGSGKDNTLLIIAAHTAVADDYGLYAARICNEYELYDAGTYYSGWYLPSLEELTWMYQNRTIINETAVINGGTAFLNTKYWSSTEFGSFTFAFYKNLSTGEEGTETKQTQLKVRAVRAF